MVKHRSPLQVSPEFKKRIDEIQSKLMRARGEKISLRDITQDIIKSPLFKEIENNIIQASNMDKDIKLKFDRRYI
jgi:hypothetical protein